MSSSSILIIRVSGFQPFALRPGTAQFVLKERSSSSSSWSFWVVRETHQGTLSINQLRLSDLWLTSLTLNCLLLGTGMHRTRRDKVQCEHRGAKGLHGVTEQPWERLSTCYVKCKGSHESCGCREDASVWFSWESMTKFLHFPQ